jgi:uncharacterized membrane protein YvlD (DUF360 family)
MDAIRRTVNVYRAQWNVLASWRPGRRALIRRAIISFVIAFIALAVTGLILPGLSVPHWTTVIEATIILSLLNLLVRPAIVAIFVGISVVAVAVASLVFQIAVFFAIAWFIPEFHVAGILTALVASFLFAGIQSILSAILAVDEDESFYGVLVAQLARNQAGVVHSDQPGVVIVQIDGLAHPILAHQIRAGRVNFISRWIRSGEMKLDSWVALLPSQTSASQAGILHGNNSFIPAFRWWEKSQGRMLVSNHPEDAAEIVRRASNGEGLLSNDGASVGNLVSGDAVRSYVTMATIKDKTQGLGMSTSFAAFFASPTNYIRTINLTLAEVAKEYVQARRSHRAGVEPSMHRGMPYPFARAGTNVALRALATSLVMEEMYRGAPVIYVDYTDYDEIAHHSGPERGETLDALDGVDRTLASLKKAAEEAPRPYRFILLSDHGQSLGSTFLQRYDQTLEQVISDLMGGAASVTAATGRVEEWGALNAAVSEAAQTTGATGALTRVALGSRTSDGSIDLAPRSEQDEEPDKAAPDGELPELVVCASGNLALIYFPRLDGRVTLETMDATWPGLVKKLASHPGIGILMVRSEAHGTVLLGPKGARYLDDDLVEGEDPTAPFGEHAITGLRRVDGMEHCGDLVAISLLDESTGEVAAFEELIGSHGGLGGDQTRPFILHPSEWSIDEPLIGAEAVYRQIRRWLEGIGIPLGPQKGTPSAASAPASGPSVEGAVAEAVAAPD